MVLDAKKSLKEYASGDSLEVVFKDLGPQIGYQTVFFWEYFGPLAIYPIFYFFPQFFYVNGAGRVSIVHCSKMLTVNESEYTPVQRSARVSAFTWPKTIHHVCAVYNALIALSLVTDEEVSNKEQFVSQTWWQCPSQRNTFLLLSNNGFGSWIVCLRMY